jgi:hypothetical protein
MKQIRLAAAAQTDPHRNLVRSRWNIAAQMQRIKIINCLAETYETLAQFPEVSRRRRTFFRLPKFSPFHPFSLSGFTLSQPRIYRVLLW